MCAVASFDRIVPFLAGKVQVPPLCGVRRNRYVSLPVTAMFLAFFHTSLCLPRTPAHTLTPAGHSADDCTFFYSSESDEEYETMSDMEL